jgi:hypothetical protein
MSAEELGDAAGTLVAGPNDLLAIDYTKRTQL